jgi:hypothetical protein
MPRHLTILAVTLLLLSGCCSITSVHPLENLQPAPYDARIEGVWIYEAKDGHFFLHLGKATDNRIEVLAVEHEKGVAMSHEGFMVSGIEINHHYYLDLDLQALPERHRDGQSGHLILKYDLTDSNTLVFSMLNLEPLVAAIGAKALAGEITYDRTPASPQTTPPVTPPPKAECARITDTSAHLHRFIANSDPDKLFSSAIVFKRVR